MGTPPVGGFAAIATSAGAQTNDGVGNFSHIVSNLGSAMEFYKQVLPPMPVPVQMWDASHKRPRLEESTPGNVAAALTV